MSSFTSHSFIYFIRYNPYLINQHNFNYNDEFALKFLKNNVYDDDDVLKFYNPLKIINRRKKIIYLYFITIVN